jgi:hypothetical protein
MNSPTTTVEAKFWDNEEDQRFLNLFYEFLKYEFYAEYKDDWIFAGVDRVSQWILSIGDEEIVILATPRGGFTLQGSETLVATIIASAQRNNLIK